MHILLIILLAPLALCFGCFLVRIWPVVVGLFLVVVFGLVGFFWYLTAEQSRKTAEWEAEQSAKEAAVIRRHPGITRADLDDRVRFGDKIVDQVKVESLQKDIESTKDAIEGFENSLNQSLKFGLDDYASRHALKYQQGILDKLTQEYQRAVQEQQRDEQNQAPTYSGPHSDQDRQAIGALKRPQISFNDQDYRDIEAQVQKNLKAINNNP